MDNVVHDTVWWPHGSCARVAAIVFGVEGIREWVLTLVAGHHLSREHVMIGRHISQRALP